MEFIRNSHPYRRLDCSKADFRILEILAGSSSERIRSRLHHATLTSSPEYDAISYTWGYASVLKTIQVDDNSSFCLTSNAEQALRDLRRDLVSTFLWIDAICINQDDVSERNQQVTIMSQIYRHAVTVRVWLDINLTADSSVLHALFKLSECSVDRDLGNDTTFWGPVIAIGDDPYWRRAWIQQEIAFARHVAVHCRRIDIPSAHLFHFHRLVGAAIDSRAGSEPERSQWLFVAFTCARFSKLPSATSLKSHEIEEVEPPNFLQQPRYKDLVEAMSSSKSLLATDPRDKFYALRSLIDDLQDQDLNVDYRVSAAACYTSIADLVLKKYCSLDFLCFAYKQDSGFVKDIPTWVPDWTDGLSACMQPTGLSSPNFASGTDVAHTLLPRLSNDRKQLQVRGFRITRVGKIWKLLAKSSREVDDNETETMWRLNDLIDILEIELSDIDKDYENVDMSSLLSSRRLERARQICRCVYHLVPDEKTEYFGRNIILTTALTMASLMKKERGGAFSAFDEKVREVWQVVRAHITIKTRNTSYAALEDDTLGLVSGEAHAEDEIWALFHCPRLMTLRPNAANYEVVGPAQIPRHIDTLVREGFPGFQAGSDTYQGYCINSITLI